MFMTPEEAKKIVRNRENPAVKLLLDQAKYIIEHEWDGVSPFYVRVPKDTPSSVVAYVRDELATAGWCTTFFNGQRDLSVDNTYNLEVKHVVIGRVVRAG